MCPPFPWQPTNWALVQGEGEAGIFRLVDQGGYFKCCSCVTPPALSLWWIPTDIRVVFLPYCYTGHCVCQSGTQRRGRSGGLFTPLRVLCFCVIGCEAPPALSSSVYMAHWYRNTSEWTQRLTLTDLKSALKLYLDLNHKNTLEMSLRNLYFSYYVWCFSKGRVHLKVRM